MAGYLGNAPTAVPLTSADITDGIITSAKIADGTIVNADINASAGIVGTKLSNVNGTITNYFSAYDTNSSGVSGDLILGFTFVNTGSNYSTTTGLYTAPSAGDYYFWFVYSRAGGSSSTFAIEKNNSTLTGAESEVAPTTNIFQQGTIQIITTLAINDTIGITTVNNAYPDKCFFGGWKIA